MIWCTHVRYMHIVCDCKYVYVWIGQEYQVKKNYRCFSFYSDSICRYSYFFNIVTPYYITFYDLLPKTYSLNSTFPSNDHFLTCFIARKWYGHLLYSQTIKYYLAQILSWNIKQNECCSLSCVYHILLKNEDIALMFYLLIDIGKNEFSFPLSN